MAAVIEVPNHHTPARGTSPGARRGTAHRGGAPVGVSGVREAPGHRNTGVRPFPMLFVAVVLIAGFLGLRSVGVAMVADPTVVPASTEHVVVGPGDTLWSIAGELDATGSRSEMVARLVELNGGELSVELGDVVVLPRSLR